MNERLSCRRRYCGAVMDLLTDGHGRVVAVCGACDRNRKRLCRDCPSRLASPTAMRCRSCSRARKLAFARDRDRARYPKRRKRVIARMRERARVDPEYREHRRRYMAAYRAREQHGPLWRAYLREYMRMRRADPVYRAKELARKRDLRAARRQQESAA